MSDPASPPAARWMQSWGALALVLLLAGVLRALGIGQWSLWQDEEMSVYFSQYQRHFFVQVFPPFFVLLGWLYELTGVSVAAGRALAGAFGLLSIGLTYGLCRKHGSPALGVIAALLLSVALGHLFWSQSVRYYTMLAAAGMGSLWLFFDGLEEGKYWKLISSGLLFVLALKIHFTAVLLLPVYVGYLLLVFALRQNTARYGWKRILAALAPMLLGLVLLAPQFRQFQASGVAGPPPVYQPPLPMLVRIAAYYGLPMLALAALSPLFWKRVPPRMYLLLFALGVIPNLELLTLGVLAMANTTWYHAFIAIHGAAGLAAVTLVGLYRFGWRKLALTTAALAGIYYAAFLGLYYTAAHGDRPRWQEGAAYLRQAIPIDGATPLPTIYATVPQVVGHYLDLTSADRWYAPQPESEALAEQVKPVPDAPPETLDEEAWFLVKASHVTPNYQAWFARHCQPKASFPARTGPIDRTIHVYYCPPSKSAGETVRRSTAAPQNGS